MYDSDRYFFKFFPIRKNPSALVCAAQQKTKDAAGDAAAEYLYSRALSLCCGNTELLRELLKFHPNQAAALLQTLHKNEALQREVLSSANHLMSLLCLFDQYLNQAAQQALIAMVTDIITNPNKRAFYLTSVNDLETVAFFLPNQLKPLYQEVFMQSRTEFYAMTQSVHDLDKLFSIFQEQRRPLLKRVWTSRETLSKLTKTPFQYNFLAEISRNHHVPMLHKKTAHDALVAQACLLEEADIRSKARLFAQAKRDPESLFTYLPDEILTKIIADSTRSQALQPHEQLMLAYNYLSRPNANKSEQIDEMFQCFQPPFASAQFVNSLDTYTAKTFTHCNQPQRRRLIRVESRI